MVHLSKSLDKMQACWRWSMLRIILLVTGMLAFDKLN
uniref:Uncharacterized protein n=1 Tax=Anguilla anguilla TaxID=7936 RepID=A0A0E9TQE9_ANGAN